MIDSQTVLEMIEAADHLEPFCTCGAPTQVIARGSRLWLACSTIAANEGRPRRRILGRFAEAGHSNRVLVELAA
jgi:hypothetical protein